jgi:uncharacterized protein YpmB
MYRHCIGIIGGIFCDLTVVSSLYRQEGDMRLNDAKIKAAKLLENQKRLKLSDGESMYLPGVAIR